MKPFRFSQTQNRNATAKSTKDAGAAKTRSKRHLFRQRFPIKPKKFLFLVLKRNHECSDYYALNPTSNIKPSTKSWNQVSRTRFFLKPSSKSCQNQLSCKICTSFYGMNCRREMQIVGCRPKILHFCTFGNHFSPLIIRIQRIYT